MFLYIYAVNKVINQNKHNVRDLDTVFTYTQTVDVAKMFCSQLYTTTLKLFIILRRYRKLDIWMLDVEMQGCKYMTTP